MRPTFPGQGAAPTDNAERLHVVEVDGSPMVDMPRSTDEARRMATALACPLVLLPGVGHIASLEAPQLVVDHLHTFLRQAAFGASR